MGNKQNKAKQFANSNNVNNISQNYQNQMLTKSQVSKQEVNFQFQQQSYQGMTYGSIQSNQKTSIQSNQKASILKLNSKAEDDNKQTVAVIVTFQQGGSYDPLFESVQQKAEEGTKVLVFQCSSHSINAVSRAFDGQYENDTLKQLITQINKVDHDCVVFNWECCSSYTGQNFTQGTQALFKFVKKMIDRKFLCMFSDFSLKALISQWRQAILGPNPFKKVGQTSQTVQIRFKAGQLKECPSAQLQTVGQMAQQGKVNVHCMGGTIMYSVNKKNLSHDQYKVQVLTVINNMKATDDNLTCTIGQFSGIAGHVLVRYPSGGAILTSMTHWIELMKVDTSEQKLFEVASRQYGENYASQQRMEYSNLNQNQKVDWRAQKATQFIQNQAPCTNMKRKARS